MNAFDAIIQNEKARSYPQSNKELFSFYTLMLITQAQAAENMKRRLWASLCALITGIALCLSPILETMNDLIAQLGTIDRFDLFDLALISYGAVGLCILVLKKGTTVFR
jgi:hypothetical protein|tara:strand:- start:1320 stop:1646 length:327 start_codon:yes stop_codon:yes gene_type:complete